jgi:hypothetical protein
MLVYSTENASKALAAGQPHDRSASTRLAETLFPSERLVPMPGGDLSDTNPPDNEVFIGCYPGVAVVAAKEFAIDKPSQLPKHFLSAAPYQFAYLHAMHSMVDWFAFAVWRAGELQHH